MKKVLTILVMVLVVTGCSQEERLADSARIKCLGGVKYWVSAPTIGYRGAMAPYVSPKTLTFERCSQ